MSFFFEKLLFYYEEMVTNSMFKVLFIASHYFWAQFGYGADSIEINLPGHLKCLTIQSIFIVSHIWTQSAHARWSELIKLNARQELACLKDTAGVNSFQ